MSPVPRAIHRARRQCIKVILMVGICANFHAFLCVFAQLVDNLKISRHTRRWVVNVFFAIPAAHTLRPGCNISSCDWLYGNRGGGCCQRNFSGSFPGNISWINCICNTHLFAAVCQPTSSSVVAPSQHGQTSAFAGANPERAVTCRERWMYLRILSPPRNEFGGNESGAFNKFWLFILVNTAGIYCQG